MYRRGWEVVVWGEGVGLQKQPRAASTDAEVAQLAAHRSNSLRGAAANEHILWSSGEDEHHIAAERSKPTPREK